MSFASHLRIRRLGEFTVGHRPAPLRLAGAGAAADPLPRGHGAGGAGDRRLAAARRAALADGRRLRSCTLSRIALYVLQTHGGHPYAAGRLPHRRAARFGHRGGGGAGRDPAVGLGGRVGARARAGRASSPSARGGRVRPTAAGEAYAPYASRRARPARAGRARGERGRGGAPAHAADQRRHDGRRVPGAPADPGLPRAPAGAGDLASTSGTARWCSGACWTTRWTWPSPGRIPDDERLVGEDFADNEFVLVTAAGDPLAQRPLGGGRGAGGAAVAAPRAGLGHAHAVRGVPGLARHRAERADARLERRDQAGGARRARNSAAVARGGGAGAELGLLDTISPRGGLPERRWHVVRSAVGPVREDVEAFMTFCGSPAARHALAG